MDWLLRGRRYDAGDLEGTGRLGANGVHGAGAVAFVAGMIAATMSFAKAPPPVNFPFHWMTPISNHFGSFYCPGTASAACGSAGWIAGADFSAPSGIVVAALVYAALVTFGARSRRRGRA